MQAIEAKLQLLEEETQRQEDLEEPVKVEMLINEIDEETYQATVEPSIKIDENEKNQCKNEWRIHRETVSRIEKQRGKTFSMMISQCT